MIVVVTIGVALALVTIAAIAIPLVRPNETEPIRSVTVSGELLARRDRIYGELRELEFDARVGKVTPDEFALARDRLESDAARVLRAIDVEVKALDDAIEREVGTLRSAGSRCPSCGSVVAEDARFCPACGALTMVPARQ